MSDFNMGQFPTTRLRRLRMKEFSRRMISENNLSVNDLIWPLFVCEGSNVAEKINSMPGVSRYSINNILKELETAVKLKIPAVALFPQIDSALKDESGSQAIDENNLSIHGLIHDIGSGNLKFLNPVTENFENF